MHGPCASKHCIHATQLCIISLHNPSKLGRSIRHLDSRKGCRRKSVYLHTADSVLTTADDSARMHMSGELCRAEASCTHIPTPLLRWLSALSHMFWSNPEWLCKSVNWVYPSSHPHQRLGARIDTPQRQVDAQPCQCSYCSAFVVAAGPGSPNVHPHWVQLQGTVNSFTVDGLQHLKKRIIEVHPADTSIHMQTDRPKQLAADIAACKCMHKV